MREHCACCKRCPSRHLRTGFDKRGDTWPSPEKMPVESKTVHFDSTCCSHPASCLPGGAGGPPNAPSDISTLLLLGMQARCLQRTGPCTERGT